jgi:hypothetical protein
MHVVSGNTHQSGPACLNSCPASTTSMKTQFYSKKSSPRPCKSYHKVPIAPLDKGVAFTNGINRLIMTSKTEY